MHVPLYPRDLLSVLLSYLHGIKKAVLDAPRLTQLKVRQLESRIRALEYSLLLSRIRYDQDKVQTSPDDQMSKVAARIDEIERQIKSLKMQVPRQVEAIREVCGQLESEEERTVIVMYYIGGFHMDEIAEAVGYSMRAAYRIRKRAQEHLDPIVKGRG